MFLSNGIPNVHSPMSLAHSPHSPFYPYPSHSPHPHQQHAHPHVPVQPNQSPHQQSNMLSMLFPQGSNASESERSSVTESSSAGSHSPDLAGSPTPSPAFLDRGRRRTRARTQTIGARTDEHSGNGRGGECADGWIGVGDEDNLGDDSDDDDEEGGFNGVLADAILKRPGSIRALSSKKGKLKETAPIVEHAEFTFPSLSELGNVSRGHSWPAELPSSDEKEDEVAEGVKQDVVETMIETAPLASVEAEMEESQNEDPH
jgi:anthranilate synthase/indole-3-glycerol phosphate synthase/phosphoribosylanthranilate isomerase